MNDLEKYTAWLSNAHSAALDSLSDCSDIDSQVLRLDIVIRLSHSLDSLNQFKLLQIKQGAIK